jgi:hypothetical protein
MGNPNSKNPIYMQHEESSSSSKGLGLYMHYERERERERGREKNGDSLYSQAIIIIRIQSLRTKL